MTEPKVIQIDPDGKYILLLNDPDKKLSQESLCRLAERLQEWWKMDGVAPLVLVDEGLNIRLEKLEVTGE